MKVYVLFNTYDETIEGTFTLEGKRAKDADFYAKAVKAKEDHIDEMCAALHNLKDRFDVLNFQTRGLATCCISPGATKDPNYSRNCQRYEDLMKEQRELADQVSKLSLRISEVTAFSTAAILKHYSVGYRWEEHELQGN